VIKVPVYDDDVYVSTILAGDKSKPVLVLVHGFGGSAALFYKVMKRLTEHFYLVMFDIIGMGASSRPEFTCADHFDTNLYMM
jgi:abhydrolase domain-containing protein 5